MSILDTMGFDPSDDSEVQRILQEYKGKTNRFVREHPFSSPAELKAIVLAPSGVEALGAERGMPILRVIVNQEFYPLMKRIYDTAGNDSRVNKDAGREINRQEGFDAMQGAFYLLHYYSPLSIAGRMAEDANQATWLYNSMEKDWDGIGEWRH